MGAHRYGYIYHGTGRPTRVDLQNGAAVPSGVDAPAAAPTVSAAGAPEFYVPRIDITEYGYQYFRAPEVQVGGAAFGTPPTAAECERPCKARAFLRNGQLSAIKISDHGKGYKKSPTVYLGKTHGTGLKVKAVLKKSGPAEETGLGRYLVGSEAANAACLPFYIFEWGELLLPGGGRGSTWSGVDMQGNAIRYLRREGGYMVFEVSIAGAKIELSLFTTVFFSPIDGITAMCPKGVGRVAFPDSGSGLVKNKAYDVVISGTGADQSGIPSLGLCGQGSPIAITFYTNESDLGGDSLGSGWPVEKIIVENGGTNYLTPPTFDFDSDGGAGLVVEGTVVNGVVTKVDVVNGGFGYRTPPTLKVQQGGAVAVAVARPHLRGKYQCYLRHVDSTPADRGGPCYSNLSPVCEVDCGEGAEKLLWSGFSAAAAAAGLRGVTLERWRTTSNQSYTLYRVPGDANEDSLTDEELRDPERAGYQAMPILLPNGELNANRFGIPPADLSVAVLFQDRLWCAVDPSGARPNTLMYSEMAEPESMPEINELIIQTNVKDSDHITALVPFGATLGVMQSRHFYRITYNSQPIIDANVAIGGYRGCINQRCWDEHSGVVYAMDTEGVYALDFSGGIKPISEGIADLFFDRVDYSKAKWFSVVADHHESCLRCSVRFKGDGAGDYPTRMLCFSFTTNSWWEERYPAPMVGGASVVHSTGERRVVYGTEGGDVLRLNAGTLDTSFGGIAAVALTNPGGGYTKPPRVIATGGSGAELESAVSQDGTLLGIYVRQPGYGYSGGALVIDPPPDSPAAEPATAEYSVTDGQLPIHYAIKSGNMEYPNDSLATDGLPDGGSRNLAVLFTPTAGPAKLKLRMYYNNAPYPRINVVERYRGTGVTHEAQEPVTSVDMNADLLPEAISSGVCRALFAGKTVDDVRGNDRHVAIELSGEAPQTGQVVIHQMDVYGTPTPQGA